MNDQPEAAHATVSDGLWRWLVGGLAAGGIILGLLIAAYAIGYHHGRHHPLAAAARSAPATSAATTTTAAAAAATTTSAAAGPVPVTAALVARGKSLYGSDGCAACHSLTGSAGVGPSFKALAGGTVTLSGGRTVTADDPYLEQSIANPDAQIVKGYRAGVMSAAIASYSLGGKADDIRALVAFIKSQK